MGLLHSLSTMISFYHRTKEHQQCLYLLRNGGTQPMNSNHNYNSSSNIHAEKALLFIASN